ncbi:MAG TPA: VOC family protein [Thermomicrobiales bacterium]|nr:VOC family protein [Thermomicrobiales bacterium]
MLIFDRLVLDVEQLDRALHFYTQALDFQVVTLGDWLGRRTALIQLGALHILLLEQPGSANPLHLPKSGPVITLSDARIVDRFDAIERMGVQILAPLAESPWGGRSFLIHDPDSYLIMIQEPGGQHPDEQR